MGKISLGCVHGSGTGKSWLLLDSDELFLEVIMHTYIPSIVCMSSFFSIFLLVLGIAEVAFFLVYKWWYIVLYLILFLVFLNDIEKYFMCLLDFRYVCTQLAYLSVELLFFWIQSSHIFTIIVRII